MTFQFTGLWKCGRLAKQEMHYLLRIASTTPAHLLKEEREWTLPKENGRSLVSALPGTVTPRSRALADLWTASFAERIVAHRGCQLHSGPGSAILDTGQWSQYFRQRPAFPLDCTQVASALRRTGPRVQGIRSSFETLSPQDQGMLMKKVGTLDPLTLEFMTHPSHRGSKLKPGTRYNHGQDHFH